MGFQSLVDGGAVLVRRPGPFPAGSDPADRVGQGGDQGLVLGPAEFEEFGLPRNGGPDGLPGRGVAHHGDVGDLDLGPGEGQLDPADLEIEGRRLRRARSFDRCAEEGRLDLLDEPGDLFQEKVFFPRRLIGSPQLHVASGAEDDLEDLFAAGNPGGIGFRRGCVPGESDQPGRSALLMAEEDDEIEIRRRVDPAADRLPAPVQPADPLLQQVPPAGKVGLGHFLEDGVQIFDRAGADNLGSGRNLGNQARREKERNRDGR